MKLKGTKQTTTLALGDIDAKAFGIDTSNGVIFDILRNKMYSNKIAAVAREISSNARDANRENKKTDTPIEIMIVEPNVLVNSTDMQIVFKDYGTGITPDRMANIFLNYGASTKRNTNKQTGGFGLGAKTPFAYTDTFTVITIYKGDKGKNVKDTYTASITDRKGVGSGEMILFNSEDTKEETGTSIVVPIRESDRFEFETECYRATAFWKVKPKFVGFQNTPWKFKEVYKGAGFNVISDEGSRFPNQYLLVIDGIPYEVDRGLLSLSSNFLHNTGLILCFHYNNGDLTISANREAVQYDRKTKVSLLWRIRQVKRAFAKEVMDKFAEKKNYIEACIFSNTIKGKLVDEKPIGALHRNIYNCMMPIGFKLEFQGKKVVESANFKWHEIVRYERYDANGKLTGLRMNQRMYDEYWNTPMFWMDAAKRDTRKNATLIDNGGFILVSSNVIELKKGKDAAQDKHFEEQYEKFLAEQAEEKAAIEALGLPIGYYSTTVPKVMPKGTSDSTYYRKTNDVSVSVRRIYSNPRYKSWESEDITFLRNEKTTQNGLMYIYIETDKLSYFGDYSAESPTLPSDEVICKGIMAAKFLDLQFVCVPAKGVNYFVEANMMTAVQAWDKVKDDPAFQATVVEAMNYEAYERMYVDDMWQNIKLVGRVSQFTLDALAVKFDKKRKKGKLENLSLEVLKIAKIKATVTDSSSVEKELKGLFKIYPMLQMFIDNGRYGKDKYVTEINEVMDAIDTVRKAPKTVRRAFQKGKVAALKGKFALRKKRNK